MKNKIMVLGTSRGGTTLISSALGLHPDIAMLDEELKGAINNIVGNKIPANKLCVPNQIELTKKWHPVFSIGLINGFFRKSLFMNKIPKGKYSIRDYEEFGVNQFILILRHPAGVLASLGKRENKKQKVAIYRWLRTLEVFEVLMSEGKSNLILFESFVLEPQEKLKNICHQLGIDYSPMMLEAPSQNARYKTDGGFNKKKTNYASEENIWDLFPKDTKERYETLIKMAL